MKRELNLKFGSDINRKFNEDGTVRFWPGNTMICLLDHNSEVFNRVKTIRDDFKNNPIGRCITFLPDQSLHMTAIEGVVDGNRSKDHWTALLPTDTKLSEVDDLFENLWKTIPPLGEVYMTFDHIRPTSSVVIALRPASDEDNRKIREWRDIVSKTFGLHFPNYDNYEFHISMGYGIWWPDEKEMENFITLIDKYDSLFKNEPFTFKVPEPSMTYFDNMFFFDKERRIRV